MDKTSSSTSLAFAKQSHSTMMYSIVVSSHLKFLISNIKIIVNTQLIIDNYSIWQSQIIKLYHANDFDGYLDESTPKPYKLTLDESNTWMQPYI